MTGNTKCILIILSVSMIWGANGLVRAEDIDYEIVDTNEVPNVLSTIAFATQANFEKIKTWECRITKDSMITIKGKTSAELLSKHTDAEPDDSIDEIKRFGNKKISFKIDTGKNWLFSFSDSTKPYIYLEPKKGKVYPSSWGPEELILVVTPEHQINISPFSKTKDGVILSRIGRKKISGRTRITDPRKVFHIGEKTLWLTLSQLSQSLQIPDIEKFGVVIKEKSSGNNITYRIEVSEPGRDRPFSIVILSSEAGFNRTYIESWYDGGSLMSKTTTEFVNLQGVFLPKKWQVSQYYPDGGLMRQETCTVEHQKINNPISESTFSEHTYLNDGDKFIDEIANKKYSYQNKQFIEVKKK